MYIAREVNLIYNTKISKICLQSISDELIDILKEGNTYFIY